MARIIAILIFFIFGVLGVVIEKHDKDGLAAVFSAISFLLMILVLSSYFLEVKT